MNETWMQVEVNEVGTVWVPVRRHCENTFHAAMVAAQEKPKMKPKKKGRKR